MGRTGTNFFSIVNRQYVSISPGIWKRSEARVWKSFWKRRGRRDGRRNGITFGVLNARCVRMNNPTQGGAL